METRAQYTIRRNSEILSYAAKRAMLLQYMSICVGLHIDDSTVNIRMDSDRTMKITSRVLNGLVKLQNQVSFPSVLFIRWYDDVRTPFELEKLQLFPSLESIECGRAFFYLKSDMPYEIPLNVWCPLIRRMDFAYSRAVQRNNNRLQSITIYVNPSPTITWFRGCDEIHLATCNPSAWPILRNLSLWINSGEYATFPPVSHLDVYSAHEDVELPAFDKSNLEMMFLSNIDADIVGECPNLTHIVSDRTILVDEAIIPNLLVFISTTALLIQTIIGFPKLQMIRLDDDAESVVALLAYMAIHGNNIRVSPNSLAVQVNAQPCVFMKRLWDILVADWRPEFRNSSEVFESEEEEEPIYEPGEAQPVPRDPVEDVDSDSETEPDPCFICVDPMKHPRRPYACACGHAICHVCASVQICPFCRAPKLPNSFKRKREI